MTVVLHHNCLQRGRDAEPLSSEPDLTAALTLHPHRVMTPRCEVQPHRPCVLGLRANQTAVPKLFEAVRGPSEDATDGECRSKQLLRYPQGREGGGLYRTRHWCSVGARAYVAREFAARSALPLVQAHRHVNRLQSSRTFLQPWQENLHVDLVRGRLGDRSPSSARHVQALQQSPLPHDQVCRFQRPYRRSRLDCTRN